MTRRISAAAARRVALAAQGFTDPPPNGRVDVRHFRRVLARVRLVQIDSVNVVARAHYLPFFSRLGPYDRDALDRWLWRSGELFEYWGHEASLIPIADRPLFAHRMAGGWHWPGIERMLHEHPEFVAEVLAEVTERGPLRSAELHRNERSGDWWGWSDAKKALEYLFLTGQVTVADRPGFHRLYDLPERVHPDGAAMAPIDADEARIELLAQAAAAHGVGTVADLADYHRIRVPDARRLLPALLARGDLVEVEVEGWGSPAYLHAGASVPRRVEASALLAPFDPVVWFRDRIHRLFGFHYRIEIYVPAHKRVHGYYVYPFLYGDDLVGRVDLKADRKAGRLLVRGAFAEPEADRVEVAAALACELQSMAGWLGLGEVVVDDRGDLAPALAAAVRRGAGVSPGRAGGPPAAGAPTPG